MGKILVTHTILCLALPISLAILLGLSRIVKWFDKPTKYSWHIVYTLMCMLDVACLLIELQYNDTRNELSNSIFKNQLYMLEVAYTEIIRNNFCNLLFITSIKTIFFLNFSFEKHKNNLKTACSYSYMIAILCVIYLYAVIYYGFNIFYLTGLISSFIWLVYFSKNYLTFLKPSKTI